MNKSYKFRKKLKMIKNKIKSRNTWNYKSLKMIKVLLQEKVRLVKEVIQKLQKFQSSI